MDPISPIEPRPLLIAPIAPARPDGLSRERRREQPRAGDREPRPRREPPHGEHEPDDEDTGGRHIDVRA
jgi:hypothetical protein